MSDYSEICLKTFLKDQGKLLTSRWLKIWRRLRLFWRTAWQLWSIPWMR